DFFAAGESDDLDYMHARYCSPHLSRFMSVDPVLGNPAIPQSWNRYAYALNAPIIYADPAGEEAALVVGEETEDNIFGHVAISINDRVYSYGTFRVNPEGDWNVPLSEYLESQVDVRESTLLELDLSLEQETLLLNQLESNNPFETKYSLMSNSCVTVCESALESTGILSSASGQIRFDTAGNALQAGAPASLTPAGLARQIKGQGLVKNTELVGGKRVSKVRALVGTALTAIRRNF
ncbi:MAG: hypothetical protein GY722_15795, partial [bacterium]|nr:hypothetical protein [bacterium]